GGWRGGAGGWGLFVIQVGGGSQGGPDRRRRSAAADLPVEIQELFQLGELEQVDLALKSLDFAHPLQQRLASGRSGVCATACQFDGLGQLAAPISIDRRLPRLAGRASGALVGPFRQILSRSLFERLHLAVSRKRLE